MERLKTYLDSVSEGDIANTAELAGLLADCWREFSGSDFEGMHSGKFKDRIEKACWRPPMLDFAIERHGATVLGSSRAELQLWRLDINAKHAAVHTRGQRQLRPMQARADIKSLADEVATLVVLGSRDERLQRTTDGRVRVLTGRIFPPGSAARQTVEGRRKRLNKALNELLSPQGWHRIGSWWQFDGDVN